MSGDSSARPGFVASLRSLGDQLIGGVQERFELVSLELQEEKIRLLLSFIWITAAVIVGALALAFTTVAVVFLFAAHERLIALWVVAGVYLLAFAIIVAKFRKFLARQPKPFATSLSMLKEDRKWVRS